MDEILFKKAQKGDLEAFEGLIKAYEKLIYNAAYRMLPNHGDAEDISQEVIIKVYKNLLKCAGANSFKSWLFRIINNTCIDEIRKRKGKTNLSLDIDYGKDSYHLENPVLRDNNTPETEYLRKDMSENIQRAINKLPPDYRAVIIMRDVNGLSYDEVAIALGINMGTVKSRIARARKKLRDEINL
ncbi:MAG: sigma-70 family RNA polymerase sigma factor [Defluviitaleaceae bacterium]|nr:sigma-70 family RNA polymerase sigma factor [Defluviitaleaceae bacterium]